MRVFHLVAILTSVFFSLSVFAGLTCSERTAAFAQEFWGNYEFTATTKAAVPRSLVKEYDLRTRYATDIEGRYQQGQQGVFFGRDGHGLSYRHVPSPFERATVVIVPGMGESMTFYKELIYSLTEEGYSVYIFDPRGQGWSGNLGRSAQIQHVRKHTDYQDDLQIFLEKIVLPHAKGEVTTLGNSNGALTIIRLAQRQPLLLPHVVAVAPPLRIFPNLPRPLMTTILHLRALAYSRYDSYALGQGDSDYAQEAVTAARANSRYALMAKERARDVSIARSGVSNGWVIEVVKAGSKALKHADRLTSNTLLIVPGADVLVVPRTGREFGQQGSTISLHEIPGAGHFVIFERDPNRNAALIEIFRFLINPKRLDAPAQPEEVERLEQASKFYASRGELAFARYAMDEAIRVHEAKQAGHSVWSTDAFKARLTEADLALWNQMKSMTQPQVALYKAITQRRLEEIEIQYGN